MTFKSKYNDPTFFDNNNNLCQSLLTEIISFIKNYPKDSHRGNFDEKIVFGDKQTTNNNTNNFCTSNIHPYDSLNDFSISKIKNNLSTIQIINDNDNGNGNSLYKDKIVCPKNKQVNNTINSDIVNEQELLHNIQMLEKIICENFSLLHKVKNIKKDDENYICNQRSELLINSVTSKKR